MAHPIIEEMNRCWSLEHVQAHAFRRWQRVLREEVQPELDKVAALTDENVALRTELEALRAQPVVVALDGQAIGEAVGKRLLRKTGVATI